MNFHRLPFSHNILLPLHTVKHVKAMVEKQKLVVGEAVERLFHDGDLLVINTERDGAQLEEYAGRYHVHIVCHGGKATFMVGDRRFTIESGDFVIWQLGAMVGDIRQSDDFNADVLLVSRIFLIENNPENIWATKGYIYIKENPVFRLAEGEKAVITADFSRCKEALASDHLFRREILGKLLQIFLYDLWNIYAREIERQGLASNVRATLFYRFMDLIRQHAAEHREVTFYSDRLCVTAKYLSEVCRDESGYPASHWIGGYATQELAAMLRNPDLTLTEIADRMRFYNQGHFSRYAKKMLGMTPSEYRRAMSGT